MRRNGSIVEEYRAIPGWEGLYSVSNMGHVRREARTEPRRAREKILKARLSGGYFWVKLRRDGRAELYRVHDLVTLAFGGTWPKGGQWVLQWAKKYVQLPSR